MRSDELVKEILHVINLLREQDTSSLSGDTLSRLAVKLASYKASLGEHVADAKKIALDAEAEYYRDRSEQYQKLRDEGKGATDADEIKRSKSHDSFMAWNKAKHNETLISNLHKDCHDLIDGIKSRLIHLQFEKGESSVF